MDDTRLANTGETADREHSHVRLTRGQVLTAWGTGFVASAVTTGVLAGAHDAAGSGAASGVANGVRGVAWASVLGFVPAVLVGLPVWFLLARLLRGRPRQWVHVAAFGLAGLVLAMAVGAALFRDLLTGVRDIGTVALLGAPWALGAAIGRLAVVPSIRRTSTRGREPGARGGRAGGQPQLR